MRGIRRRLVEAASGVTGARFRALAAASMIASSAIIGSALAGDDSGWLAALLSRAQGEATSPATADAANDPGAGPQIPLPPPPSAPAGPLAAGPAAPAAAQPAAAAPATTTTPSTTTPTEDTEPTVPDEPAVGSGPVKHVFVISLSSPGYEAAFGDGSLMPYLAETLRPDGELLTDYSLLTEAGLPNRDRDGERPAAERVDQDRLLDLRELPGRRRPGARAVSSPGRPASTRCRR